MSEVLDEAILNTLTPEERAAIEDPEYTPDQVATLKSLAEGAPDDADDGDGGDDDVDEVLDADGNPVTTTTEIAPADKPAESAKTTPQAADVAPAKGPQAQPLYHAALPENFSAQTEALQDRASDLAEQFKSGTLDFDSYNTAMAAVNADREALNLQRVKAEISQEMQQQSQQQQWQSTVNATMDRAAKDDGINYRADEEKQKKLDMFVRALGADEANADKPMQWFVDEAHKAVKAYYGIGTVNPAAPSADRPANSRKPPIDAAPQTLALVAGGGGAEDVTGNPFAHLDKLTGYEYEDALKKLSPAQQERYLRGA